MFPSDLIRDRCRTFVGRTREATDTLAPEAARKLAVLRGAPEPGPSLPPTWHWIYFTAGIPEADLNDDLHEKTGRFLPPAPYQRRMWAGGDVAVHAPLRIGVPATRRSEVTSVEFKDGRSGSMCFVTVRHRIAQGGRDCIEEIQTIVYRDRGRTEKPLRQPDDPIPDGHFVHPDSRLFFYSSVTHNGHRIHWDRAYCRDVEGYPDLVVHGPLMATELCDAMRGDRLTGRFAYRAEAPVFTSSPVRIEPGTPGEVQDGRIVRSDGVTSMSASLTAV